MKDGILALLNNKGPLTGRQLLVASKGSLKKGTVYVLLDRMEDEGLVSSKKEARRVYSITNQGCQYLSGAIVGSLLGRIIGWILNIPVNCFNKAKLVILG